MRLLSLTPLVLIASSLVSVPGLASDGNHAPEMNAISARTAKPGDTLIISGVSLSENRIDEVYLTDHKFDMKMKVLEQKDSYIKVRVPPFAKPGRMQILCLTKGDNPTLLEQPLYVLIKDPSDTTVDNAEPTVETIEMKLEDLPQPGAPISIPIQAAPQQQAQVQAATPEAKADVKPEPGKKVEPATQVSQVKKSSEPAKSPEQDKHR
ncbi:MAG TPA: hypothetical protein VKX39_16710 [Bryobacteraceae bacterium]|jgi:hypothetical protein|nr:hypothetical protein [Bryobacteraceae bacterium]